MNEERKKILGMLAAGKITAEDAERLLEKLGLQTQRETPTPLPAETDAPTNLKYLRVLVDSADGDKVNVRVPLALIKTGIKLTAMLPDHANDQLCDQGVDLSKLADLEADELNEALRELRVDVDSGDGDIVRVFCE